MDDIRAEMDLLEASLESLEDENLRKVFKNFISVLRKIDSVIDELTDYITSIDEDLSDLEASVYTDEEPVVVICRKCGEEFFIPASEDYDGNEVICPNCGEVNLIGVKEG